MIGTLPSQFNGTIHLLEGLAEMLVSLKPADFRLARGNIRNTRLLEVWACSLAHAWHGPSPIGKKSIILTTGPG